MPIVTLMKLFIAFTFVCVQSLAALQASAQTLLVSGNIAPHSHDDTYDFESEHDDHSDVGDPVVAHSSHDDSTDGEHNHTHRHAPGEPEHTHSHQHTGASVTNLALVNVQATLAFKEFLLDPKYHQFNAAKVKEPILGSLFRPPISLI